jgi:uncharacterized BrkB/YihY/UPF0761 family membrane protein
VSRKEIDAIARATTPKLGFYVAVILLACVAPRVAAFGYLLIASSPFCERTLFIHFGRCVSGNLRLRSHERSQSLQERGTDDGRRSRSNMTLAKLDDAARRRVDRERVMRTLTFWLRPEFVLRVVNRFQKVGGFDRSVALASSALTAVISLMILVSALAVQLGGKGTAERIIERYGLTGGGAEAVRDIFSSPAGASTGLSVVGAFFLLVAVLSFARAAQRLFEQTWELKPLSVRNSVNGLLWIGGFLLYAALGGVIHAVLGRGKLELAAALVDMPVAAVFLAGSGWLLSGKRISLRDLVPFAVVGSVLLAVYSVGATVYVPHLFSTYATRYGVIGAVFAMISALFCIMVVTVTSAAAGREVHDELERIRRGEKPAEDEVRRQWDELTAEVGSRWETLRERRRRRDKR